MYERPTSNFLIAASAFAFCKFSHAVILASSLLILIFRKRIERINSMNWKTNALWCLEKEMLRSMNVVCPFSNSTAYWYFFFLEQNQLEIRYMAKAMYKVNQYFWNTMLMNKTQGRQLIVSWMFSDKSFFQMCF